MSNSTKSVSSICPVCQEQIGVDTNERCIYFCDATAQKFDGTDMVYITRTGGKCLRGVIHRDCFDRLVGR